MPPKPPGIHEPTEELKKKQKGCPTQWTMTVKQFLDVMKHIIGTQEYQIIKSQSIGKSVNFYKICEDFVKPWTRGTGCGLSVLMGGSGHTPATLMTSHAWQEDVEECIEAVERAQKEQKIPDNAGIWFCVFANYQAEDLAVPGGSAFEGLWSNRPGGSTTRPSLTVRVVSLKNGLRLIWGVR